MKSGYLFNSSKYGHKNFRKGAFSNLNIWIEYRRRFSSDLALAKNCIKCGGDISWLIEYDRHGVRFPIYMCEECGKVSPNQIPSNEDLDLLYSKYYRVLYPFPQRQEPPAASRILKKIAEDEVHPRSILDYGGGDGSLAMTLARSLTHSVVQFYEPGKGFMKVKIGPEGESEIVEYKDGAGGHELICLVHVLEHVSDPLSLLMELRRLVADEALVYLETPSLSNIITTSAGDFAREAQLPHLSYFFPDEVIALANEAGFDVLEFNNGGSYWLKPLTSSNEEFDTKGVEILESTEAKLFYLNLSSEFSSFSQSRSLTRCEQIVFNILAVQASNRYSEGVSSVEVLSTKFNKKRRVCLEKAARMFSEISGMSINVVEK